MGNERIHVDQFVNDLALDEASEDKNRMDKIRIYPDPILRKKAQTIENIDGRVKDIADRMARVMYANKGIGLAAPQIGILSRILIVDLGEGRGVLINPEIVEQEGESVMDEGCLSLPNIKVPVKRNEKVLIRGWNLECKEVNMELFGFPGRVYQHEIDHLNGVLIIHHISRLKRELLLKKMRKDLSKHI
ncbi:MAG: peptide deformylase [Syntrophaceae bacterium]|nr:peptide deformylase [Syntrophaceae bacterium]